MSERELMAARAKAKASKGALTSTISDLKYRLKPSTLASDAWHGVRSSSSEYAGKGMNAMTDHPAAAGGAVAAIALFFLRGPLAILLAKIFGDNGERGRVTTKLTSTNDDFDLTAPVVIKS